MDASSGAGHSAGRWRQRLVALEPGVLRGQDLPESASSTLAGTRPSASALGSAPSFMLLDDGERCVEVSVQPLAPASTVALRLRP